jgi:AbrB family looped-hinge helix DNA binding protein
MPQLIEVTHISKRGTSLRITLPKKAAEILDVKSGDIVGFYEDNGSIVLRKMK